MLHSLFRLFMTAAVAMGCAAEAATDFPVKPIKIVVPYAPGGGADTSTRLIARKLEEQLGQPVVVDNRPGANGVVGINVVARSAPDGYTLVSTSLDTATTTFIKAMPVEPMKELAPVSLFYKGGFLILVASTVPAKTIQEFIAYAKANPGKLNVGVSTAPTLLAADMFRILAGVNMERIVYKGEADIVRAMLAGEIQMAVSTPTAYRQVIASGSVRPLAATGEGRNPMFPNLPTLREAGLKDYVAAFNSGFWAPAGTPADVIEKLSKAFATVASQPDVREYFKVNTAAETVGSTPEDLMRATQATQAVWARAAADTGYKPD